MFQNIFPKFSLSSNYDAVVGKTENKSVSFPVVCMLYKILRSMNLFSLGSERRRISSFAFVTLILTAEWIFIKVVKFEEYSNSVEK